jgi:hypothetical protein
VVAPRTPQRAFGPGPTTQEGFRPIFWRFNFLGDILFLPSFTGCVQFFFKYFRFETCPDFNFCSDFKIIQI